MAVHFVLKWGLQQEPTLTMNNLPIKVQSKVKFFGIYLDQRLRYKKNKKNILSTLDRKL